MHYLNMTRSLVIGLAFLVIQGCATMSQDQQTQYTLMEKNGVLVEEKSPTTGAWLGLLPGGGAFYGRSPWVGVVDLLLWPISVVWDPIVGYERAKMVNYDVTTANLAREKDKELNTLDNQLRLKQIDEQEYVIRKREIEHKYNYSS